MAMSKEWKRRELARKRLVAEAVKLTTLTMEQGENGPSSAELEQAARDYDAADRGYCDAERKLAASKPARRF